MSLSNFQSALLDRESGGNYDAVNQGGYLGGYQFSAQTLETLGFLKKDSSRFGNDAFNDPSNWTGKEGVRSREAFLNNPSAQDLAFQENLAFNRRVLENRGVIDKNTSDEDVHGWLASAHLLGASQAAVDLKATDGNGISGQEYFDLGKNSFVPINAPVKQRSYRPRIERDQPEASPRGSADFSDTKYYDNIRQQLLRTRQGEDRGFGPRPVTGFADITAAGFDTTVEQLGVDWEYFKAMGNTLLGDEKAAARNIDRARVREEFAAIPLQTVQSFGRFFDEPTVEGFFTQVSKAPGLVAPYIVTSIVGAGVGAVAAAVGKGVLTSAGRAAAKKLIRESAEKVAKKTATPDEKALIQGAYDVLRGTRRAAAKGALVGAGVAEYIPMAASNLSEALEVGEELDRGTVLRAGLVALPQAVVGVGGEYLVAKHLLNVAKKRVTKEGSVIGRLIADISKSGLRSGAVGGTTEVIQEGIGVANRSDLDDEYTAQDGKLRIAEAAFMGFFGEGAFGAAGGGGAGAVREALNPDSEYFKSLTSSVLSKSKELVEKGRDATVGAIFDKEQYGDLATGLTSPEPESDIQAQLDAMTTDKTSQKKAVWIAGEAPQQGATKDGNITTIAVNGYEAFAAFIPGKGTIISTNKGLVEAVIKDKASDRALQIALGYSAVKDVLSGEDIVIQAQDKVGNVVSEELTTEENLESARAAATRLMPEGGSVIQTTLQEALERRKKRLEQEKSLLDTVVEVSTVKDAASGDSTEKSREEKINDESFVYKTDKMEVYVVPTLDGTYKAAVSLKDGSSNTGYRLREDLTQSFETQQEAKDYANKIIDQLERASTRNKEEEKSREGPATSDMDVSIEVDDFTRSTASNPLIREARDSVREALVKMNFKFVDEENAPDITDIERIASKILKGLNNDDAVFIKDAAESLSYALYIELGGTERSDATRLWVQESLEQWLTTGEAPTTNQSLWIKVLEIYNRLLSFFASKEYTAISDRLESAIDRIKTGQDFSFRAKEGYAALNFQNEMDNNPQAATILMELKKAGLQYALTGSVAYADQVPVYRKEGVPLHDLDMLIAEEDIAVAQELLSKGAFGKSGVLYEFAPKGKAIVGLAVVPSGYEVRNIITGWKPKTNAIYRSYEVFDSNTNEKVGSYSFEANSHETFEGAAGVTVDLMSATSGSEILQQPVTIEGKPETIPVVSYVEGFTAKLGLLRLKDINDFLAVVPPDPTGREADQAPAYSDMAMNWNDRDNLDYLAKLFSSPQELVGEAQAALTTDQRAWEIFQEDKATGVQGRGESYLYSPRREEQPLFGGLKAARKEFQKIFAGADIDWNSFWEGDRAKLIHETALKKLTKLLTAERTKNNITRVRETVVDGEEKLEIFSYNPEEVELFNFKDEKGQTIAKQVPIEEFLELAVDKSTKGIYVEDSNVTLVEPDGDKEFNVNLADLTYSGQRIVEQRTGKFSGQSRDGFLAIVNTLLLAGYEIRFDGKTLQELGIEASGRIEGDNRKPVIDAPQLREIDNITAAVIGKKKISVGELLRRVNSGAKDLFSEGPQEDPQSATGWSVSLEEAITYAQEEEVEAGLSAEEQFTDDKFERTEDGRVEWDDALNKPILQPQTPETEPSFRAKGPYSAETGPGRTSTEQIDIDNAAKEQKEATAESRKIEEREERREKAKELQERRKRGPASRPPREDSAAFNRRQTPVVARPTFDQLPSYKEGQTTKTYAGIGARNAPPSILSVMTELATRLQRLGYTLYSGKADGSDKAFEAGAGSQKEIFVQSDATDQTRKIAKEIHPAPDRLKSFPLNLMARNTNQIFGANLNQPVDFVVTWTPDGVENSEARTKKTGGTGQAIDMASRKGIPVINMYNEGWQNRLEDILAEAAFAPRSADMAVAPTAINKLRGKNRYDVVISPESWFPGEAVTVAAEFSHLGQKFIVHKPVGKPKSKVWTVSNATTLESVDSLNASSISDAVEAAKRKLDETDSAIETGPPPITSEEGGAAEQVDVPPITSEEEYYNTETNTLEIPDDFGIKDPVVLGFIRGLLDFLQLEKPPIIITTGLLESNTGYFNLLPEDVLDSVNEFMNVSKTSLGRTIYSLEGPVIILRSGMDNSLAEMLVGFHEIGHALWDNVKDEIINKSPAIYRRLLDNFNGHSQYNTYLKNAGGDHSTAFNEFFADQVVKWASKQFRNRKPKNIVEKVYADFASKLRAFWRKARRDYKKHLMSDRFGRFGARGPNPLAPDFEVFLDEVVASRKEGRALSPDMWVEKTLVKEMNEVTKKQMGPQLEQAVNYLKRLRDRIIKGDEIRAPYALFATADSYLRLIAGNEIADLFYLRAQQVRDAAAASLLGMVAQLGRAREKIDDKFIRTVGLLSSQEVIDAVEEAYSSFPDEIISPLAQKVRAFYRDLYKDYIKPSNSNIKEAKNYTPTVLDLEKIAMDPDAFIDLILTETNQGGDPKSRALIRRAVAELMQEDDGVLEQLSESVWKMNPQKAVEKQRQLTSGIAPEKLKDFSRPPVEAHIEYIKNLTRRVEWNRHTKDARGRDILGPMLEKLPADKRDRARQVIEIYLGYQKSPMSPFWRDVNSWAQVIQFYMTIPFAVLASLTEFAGPMIRSKDFAGFADGLRTIVATIEDRKQAEIFARDLGIISAETVATVFLTEADRQFMTESARNASDAFFKYTGLTSFTRFTRIFASKMAVNFIIRHSDPATMNKDSLRYLKELDLTPEEVRAWVEDDRGMETPGGKKIGAGITRFVEDSILRPNVAERPMWANDPRFALIWQLKGFFWSYGKVIMAGVAREARTRLNNGETVAAGYTATATLLALAAVTTFPLAMMGMELREYAKYGLAWLLPGIDASNKYFRSDTMNWPTYMAEIMDRSGMYGPFTVLSTMQQQAEWGRSPIMPALGPTAEMIETIVSNGFDVGKTLRTRVVPFVNQI